MEKKSFAIQGIPAVMYGERSEKGYLFVHGQSGNKEEAEAFAEIAVPAGFQVMGVDLPGHGERREKPDEFVPWTAVPELKLVMADLKERWREVSIRANSIGAYFSMLAFSDEKLGKALFVSPIADMEQLIRGMMALAGVTEDMLRERGEIPTDSGQTLSWRYLCWVREHRVAGWRRQTAVLYAGQDDLTPRETIEGFAAAHGARLTVYEPGEHWFHTPDQLTALRAWERNNL